MSAKKLDEIFEFKSKAGHWLRLDHGRSLPSVSDYKRLKDILELDAKKYKGKIWSQKSRD